MPALMCKAAVDTSRVKHSQHSYDTLTRPQDPTMNRQSLESFRITPNLLMAHPSTDADKRRLSERQPLNVHWCWLPNSSRKVQPAPYAKPDLHLPSNRTKMKIFHLGDIVVLCGWHIQLSDGSAPVHVATQPHVPAYSFSVRQPINQPPSNTTFDIA